VGFRLVATNGATGRVYADVPLQGSTNAEGFWVLAHPDANEELRAVAAQLDPGADLQNGPDSVSLMWGDERVDALAYSIGADVEVGEGDAAAAAEPGQSLSRDAGHTDTDDNATDFAAGVPTPGQ
jgi:hypothetical protein